MEQRILEKESCGVARTEINDQLAIARTRGRKGVVRDDSLNRAPSLRERMKALQQQQPQQQEPKIANEGQRPKLVRKQAIGRKNETSRSSTTLDTPARPYHQHHHQQQQQTKFPAVRSRTSSEQMKEAPEKKNVQTLTSSTDDIAESDGKVSKEKETHASSPKVHDGSVEDDGIIPTDSITSLEKCRSKKKKPSPTPSVADIAVKEYDSVSRKVETDLSPMVAPRNSPTGVLVESNDDSTLDAGASATVEDLVDPSHKVPLVTTRKPATISCADDASSLPKPPSRQCSNRKEGVKEQIILAQEPCGAARSNIDDQLGIARTRGRKSPVRDTSLKRAPSLQDRMKAFQQQGGK